MEWQTPIGLPVVQPYHKRSSKEVGSYILWENFARESMFLPEELFVCQCIIADTLPANLWDLGLMYMWRDSLIVAYDAQPLHLKGNEQMQ